MSARPTSTRRPWPRLRCSIGSSASSRRPEQLEHLVAGGDLVGAWAARGREVLPEPAVAAAGPLGDQQVLADRGAAEQLDALERAADARAGPARAPAGRRCRRPSSCTVPPSGGSTPSRQLKNVVLPAPLGPMSPTRSPSRDLQVDLGQGDDAREGLGDVVGLRAPASRDGLLGGTWRTAAPGSGPRRRRGPPGEQASRSRSCARALAVLDQALGVAGERDGGQAEQHEPPLGRDAAGSRGCSSSLRRIQREDRALEDDAVHEREARAGVAGALDRAGAERDDEHQPEQRGERREVAARSSRSSAGSPAARRRGRR